MVIGAPCTKPAVSKPSTFRSFQSVHWEDTGAFTGEISAAMLKELGVTHAIIGHSERQFFGRRNCPKRTELYKRNNSIVCVGELLADGEAEHRGGS